MFAFYLQTSISFNYCSGAVVTICSKFIEETGLIMDPAQEFEALMLSRQKPMNDLIPHGNSPIQQFYKGKTVFVTGGSGFLGKQLIEKFFRSCEIKKMYMLIRPKKGKSTKERLQKILEDVVFDSVRKQRPDFAEKIVAVEGDTGTIRLGLSDSDWAMLTKEVNIIVHAAATIRFDESLRQATLINVLGTREVLQLARDCSDLKCLTYVSTAYTHTTEDRINQDVLEQFYPCPVSPDFVIDLATTVDEERINKMTEGLIQGWPNTYTFTKALAEELVRRADDLPICVVKPPFVVNAYLEPAPGWIDLKICLSGPIGLFLGIGLGVIHIFQIDDAIKQSYAPVDFVNNAIMAAGWDMVERKRDNNKDQDNIYIITNYGRGMKWKETINFIKDDEMVRFITPKAVWYAWGCDIKNEIVYTVLLWLVHYLPAYAIDAIVDMLKLRPKDIPPLLKVYSKVDKVSKVYKYFLFHDWNLNDNRLKSMINRMSAEDRIIFNCNIDTIDPKDSVKTWVIGLRRYIIKDGLEGSKDAYKKQKWLGIANALVALLYGYLIWKVLYLVYSVLTLIF